jgi:hypothetical protein
MERAAASVVLGTNDDEERQEKLLNLDVPLGAPVILALQI